MYFPQGRVITGESNTYLLASEAGKTVVTTEVRESNRAIIYFGGNAEDVSLNLGKFKNTFPDFSLYLMHYRGYGGSDGKPSEDALYKDADALYELVSKSNDEIVLIGRSLGTGIATKLAAERSPSKLILVTPYSSIEDVVSGQFWFFPVSLLIKDKYPSWTYAKTVEASTSILIASNDQVIPLESSMKLYGSFKKGIATVYSFKNTGHNSISSNRRYYDLLNKLTKSSGR